MSELLLIEAGGVRCALPVESVVETLRPFAVQALSALPPYVLGAMRIRGTLTPVVDLGLILTGEVGPNPRRLVLVRVDGVTGSSGCERRIALAVNTVQSVTSMDEVAWSELPPLLGGAAGCVVRSLGERDGKLLATLEAGRAISAELWKTFESQAEASQ